MDLVVGRAINWLDSTSRSLQGGFPDAADAADYVTERLSALMLERLTPQIAAQLLELLPEDVSHGTWRELDSLRTSAHSSGNPSIGFVDFVERTRHALGLTELLDSPAYENSEEAYEQLCHQIADAFLWAVAYEVPAEIKIRMTEELPLELRSRMNLYGAHSEREKVA